MIAASYTHTQAGIDARRKLALSRQEWDQAAKARDERKAAADPEVIERRRRQEEQRRQEADERERALNRCEMLAMAKRLARLEKLEAKRAAEVKKAQEHIAAQNITPRAPRMKRIAERICKATGYSLDDMKSERRNRDVVLIRQAIMYWLARHAGKSLPEIGGFLGGRDHTTCLHGIRAYPKKRRKAGRHLRALDTSSHQHGERG